jgi:hypothetical protein
MDLGFSYFLRGCYRFPAHGRLTNFSLFYHTRTARPAPHAALGVAASGRARGSPPHLRRVPVISHRTCRLSSLSPDNSYEGIAAAAATACLVAAGRLGIDVTELLVKAGRETFLHAGACFIQLPPSLTTKMAIKMF